LPSGLGQLATQFGLLSSRGVTTSPQFYADLLVSREMQRDVVTSQYSALGSTDSANLLNYFDIAADTGTRAVLRAMKRLQDLYSVRPDRLTGVVHLEVHTRIPNLSVQIAHRFLELVNEYNLRRRQSQARAEREFAGQQVAMDKENWRPQRMRSPTSIGGTDVSPIRQVCLRRREIEATGGAAAATLRVLAQGYETAKIDEVRNTPVITIVEHPEGLVEPTAWDTQDHGHCVVLVSLLSFGIASWTYTWNERAWRHRPSTASFSTETRSRRGLRRMRLWK